MRINPLLSATDVPPIPAAQTWAEAYDGRHGPLLNLAQAVPGAPSPDLLARLGAEAALASNAAYGPILGEPALRAALAADMSLVYGAAIAPERVAITAGGNQAFFVTLLALAGPGDEILLPAPWYFNHKMTADMLGITARPLPCFAQHGFVPQVEAAAELLTPRTRAIVLVTPNNPTGAVYPAETLAAFLDLARARGVALILDETYRDFLPPGQERPHGLFAAPAAADHLVHLYSFSKSMAVPGHRLGALVAAPACLEEVAKVLDSLMICPPRAAQQALAWGVGALRPWRAQTRADIAARADLFAQAIAAVPGWSLSAIGAFFAYVRHPFEADGESVAARLAASAGVLALPGGFFGEAQSRHLRFAFANADPHGLASLAQRMADLAA